MQSMDPVKVLVALIVVIGLGVGLLAVIKNGVGEKSDFDEKVDAKKSTSEPVVGFPNVSDESSEQPQPVA